MKFVAVILGAIALASAAPSPCSSPATKLTQSQAEALIGGAGISHSSSGGCTTRSNSHCTSYEGMRCQTMRGVIAFKRNTGCAVTITAGTEVGHSTVGTHTHYNGWKLDLKKTSCVNRHVIGFGREGNCSGGFRRYLDGKTVYCDEHDHWDVQYL